MIWKYCVFILFTLAPWTTILADDGEDCVIELQCAECLPEHMPLVTSHRAEAGRVRVPAGHELRLSCGAGRLLAYPLHAELAARCAAGRLRVQHDGALRHLLELGCQEDVFEDVLHAAPHCAPPLQGRAYHLREAAGARHVAELCYDEDRGLAAFAHLSSAPGNELPAARHGDGAPLSLFGNLNAMLDSRTTAEVARILSDDARMNRRLRELLRHDDVSLAGHTLTSARLLAPAYFEDQNARAAEFASNKAAAWSAVAAGNLAHLQRDVAALLRAAAPRALDVYAGALGAASVRADGARRELLLGAGRFPVPRYFWTVVRERATGRGLALVVLNDPLVAVSEIREAVFCESMCGRVSWARALRRHRRYEAPALGLAFCCSVRALAAAAPGLPRALLPASDSDDTLLTHV